MRRYVFPLVTIVTIACAALGGCADLYMPRFDGGLENPDIRLLRVPEFMNGVKCGLVAFMHERERNLLEARVADDRGMYHNIEAPPGSKLDKVPRVYSPYHLNMTVNMRKCGYDRHARCVNKRCLEPQDWQCVDNPCDVGLISPEGDHRMGVALWDYSARKCVPIPDYNRFALDETQSAQIQLKMTAVNSGYVHFSKIDAVKSGLFPFVAVGGGASGNPFPVLNIDPKRTTVFDMTALMPQSVHTFNQTIGPAVFTGTGRAEQALRNEGANQLRFLLKDSDKGVADRSVLADRPGLPEKVAGREDDLSGLRERVAMVEKDIQELRKRAEALPGSYPGWEDELKRFENETSKANERISKLHAKIRMDGSGGVEKNKADIDVEERKINVLVEQFTSDTADLRSALEHDENVSSWIETVVTNIADYIVKLPKPLKLDSVALAQEVLAERSEKLVSGALEIRDKAKVAERLAFIEDHLGRLRKLLSEARKDVEERAAAKKAAVDEEKAANKAFTAPKQDQEFDFQCRPDIWSYVIDQKTRIDFLGLKSLLDNLYAREASIYRGIPDISLSQLVLTSEFNLALEVSAGMNYFRFIPILAAPGAALKTDHTHNLKVTLAGKKNKNSPGNNTGSKNLIASCEQRVSGGTATSENFCASAPGQMLENILQSVSSSGGSSAQ